MKSIISISLLAMLMVTGVSEAQTTQNPYGLPMAQSPSDGAVVLIASIPGQTDIYQCSDGCGPNDPKDSVKTFTRLSVDRGTNPTFVLATNNSMVNKVLAISTKPSKLNSPSPTETATTAVFRPGTDASGKKGYVVEFAGVDGPVTVKYKRLKDKIVFGGDAYKLRAENEKADYTSGLQHSIGIIQVGLNGLATQGLAPHGVKINLGQVTNVDTRAATNYQSAMTFSKKDGTEYLTVVSPQYQIKTTGAITLDIPVPSSDDSSGM